MGTIVHKDFRSCNRGFWLKFPCGYTLSTQFGYMNYCENRHVALAFKRLEELRTAEETESATCEIAVWEGDEGDWVTRRVWQEVFDEELNDDVQGHVTMKQWLKVVAYLTNLK